MIHANIRWLIENEGERKYYYLYLFPLFSLFLFLMEGLLQDRKYISLDTHRDTCSSFPILTNLVTVSISLNLKYSDPSVMAKCTFLVLELSDQGLTCTVHPPLGAKH